MRSSDGPALAAAAGKSLTLAAADLANPGFKGYASFTSGGPRTGDSGLKPSISAPGVSIVSTGVGTGNGPRCSRARRWRPRTSPAWPPWPGRRTRAGRRARSAPRWSARPTRPKVAGYRLTLGGGLVDAKQAVSTQVFAIGDRYSTRAGKVYEGTLSFGFAEPSSTHTGKKKLTLVNKGSKRVTFTLKNQKTSQSRPATVRFSRTRVVVPAKSSRTVNVTLRVKASTVGTSLSSTTSSASTRSRAM